MPAIGAIGGSSDPRFPREQRLDSVSASGTRESRALVPISPGAASEGLHESPHRPTPAFLAHLAATRLRAPQTRVGRRAEPAEAVATYGAALVPPALTGRVFRRSV